VNEEKFLSCHDVLRHEQIPMIGAGFKRAFGRMAIFAKMCENRPSLLEDQIGFAFLVSQQYIAYVVSSCKSSINVSRSELLCAGSSLINNTQITKVQAIDALGNYYRYRDEWIGSWESLQDSASKITEILLMIGLEQYSDYIFYDALGILEIPDCSNLPKLADFLDEWGSAIEELYLSR